MMHTVHIQPGDKKIDISAGTPLTVVIAEAGFVLRNDCGGTGTCGKCAVRVNGKKVLACRVTVDADLEVEVPDTSLKSGEEAMVVQLRSFVSEKTTIVGHQHRYGVALDIGTTTLAAEFFEMIPSAAPRLLGVASRANPQRRYGDDVISRIQRVIEEPGSLATLHELIIGTVNEMLRELAEKTGILTTDISLLSVAGNTVMEYLFLGIDPSPLGFAPFTPPITEFRNYPAGELGLDMNSAGLVETLPIFGGFVGGDVVAGVLATGLHSKRRERQSPQVLIDIGTNGELVLCCGDELDTAATAAGPAFEGGRIEFGSLAVPGAIDRVELHDGRVRISTIAGRPATGLCGSGLIDAVSELLRHGLIKPTGQFHVKPDSPFFSHWGMFDDKPAFVLVPADESGRGEAILLTQRDVRQLQLASGAIRAGIQLLLRRREIRPENIETFYVAGGFGSFIQPEAARRIGLLPAEIPLNRIRFCGNTSLAGARQALFDPRFRDEAVPLTRRAHHLDLATLPDFATVFAESMIFNEERIVNRE